MSRIRWAPRHSRNLVSGLFLIVVGVVVLAARIREPALAAAIAAIVVGVVLCAISAVGLLRKS